MTKFEIVDEIIRKKVSYNDDNYPVYYLCCYGFIEYFGHNYLPLVEKLFDVCNFYIDDKSIEELCTQNNVDISEYAGNDLKALSLSGISFSVNPSTMEFEIYQKEPRIICSTSGNPNLVLIEFVHEAAHILKGLINNINISDDGKSLAIRSGLYLDIADIYCGYVENDSYNFILDEIINVFQTADIMKTIKTIDCSQLPKSVLDFYHSLNLDELDVPYGYDEYLDFVKPLWECEQFRNSVFDCAVIGDLASIEEGFNNVVGEEVFGQMSSMLDGLCFGEFDVDEHSGVISFINDVVSSYGANVHTDSNKVKINKVDT